MNDTRYFTDGVSIWKFPTRGHPQTRDKDAAEWERSAFFLLSEFLKSPGDVKEITKEKGEPS